jgi:hypothetical protein
MSNVQRESQQGIGHSLLVVGYSGRPAPHNAIRAIRGIRSQEFGGRGAARPTFRKQHIARKQFAAELVVTPPTLFLTPSSRKTHRLLSLPLPPVPDTLGTVEFGKGLPSAVSAPSARAAPEGEIFSEKRPLTARMPCGTL